MHNNKITTFGQLEDGAKFHLVSTYGYGSMQVFIKTMEDGLANAHYVNDSGCGLLLSQDTTVIPL